MSGVVLMVYDISRGLASSLGNSLLGNTIEGVWHTGIVVFETEYFYGGGVVQLPQSKFETEYNLHPSKRITLGSTTKTKQEFDRHLSSISDRFTEASYDILHWNCNHFTNECSKYLLGQEIPREYLHQHEALKQNPIGAQILRMLEKAPMTNPIQNTRFDQPVHTTPYRMIMSFEDETKMLNETKLGLAVKKLLDSEHSCHILEKLVVVVGNILTNALDPAFRSIDLATFPHFPKMREDILSCLCAMGFIVEKKDDDASPVGPSGSLNSEVVKFPEVTAKSLNDLAQCHRFLHSVLQTRHGKNIPRFLPPMPHQEPSYTFQMQQLEFMGFTDRQLNLQVLKDADGNINRALDKLTG